MCACSWQEQISPSSGPPPFPPPVVGVDTLLGGHWQELNVGRAVASRAQSEACLCKCSSSQDEHSPKSPSGPWETLRAAFPFKPFLFTLARLLVSWLHGGSFPLAESPACGLVVSMLAAAVTVTLQGLLWYRDLSRARNWVLFSLGDDCPEQGHCLQGLALTLWIQNPLLEVTFTES